MPTVLFVDDEPNLLRSYRDTFRRDACEVLLASSGYEALEILAKNPVEIVVSDERMPLMSGAELLQRIHREYPDVVRIMLTGHASLSASMQVINDGLYRFLSKPIMPSELRRVIHDALHIKKLSWAANVSLGPIGGASGRSLKFA